MMSVFLLLLLLLVNQTIIESLQAVNLQQMKKSRTGLSSTRLIESDYTQLINGQRISKLGIGKPTMLLLLFGAH